jgi:MoxR-like ATPase
MKTITVKELTEDFRVVEIQGRVFQIPWPDRNPLENYVARDEIVDNALAVWGSYRGDKPKHLKFYGPPGSGKTSLVFHLAARLGKDGAPRDVYVMNGSSSRNTEDIAVEPVQTGGQNLVYSGTPLLAAALFGGICLFDEIAKAPTDMINQLSELLDNRRTLTSTYAGLRFTAHRDFLFCATLNEDEEQGGRIPDHIDDRLFPAYYVGLPTPGELVRILESQARDAHRDWVEAYLDEHPAPASVRRAIDVIESARCFARAQKKSKPRRAEIREYLRLVEKAGEGPKQGEQP